MVTIFKRGNKLYLQFTVNQKRKQKSTGLDDTPANRKSLKKEVIPALIQKIVSGEYEEEMRKKEKRANAFEHYAEIYLKSKDGIKTYYQLASVVNNQILPLFGKKSIDAIKRSHIVEFRDKLLEKVTPKRASYILGTLSSIIDVALEYDHIETNPARGIKLPKHKKKTEEPFTKEEVQKLLDAAEGWFRNYLAFAFYTGARVGELIALTWADVDLDAMSININKSRRQGVTTEPKTYNAIRKVPIFVPLVPYIKDQMSRSKSVFVFANPKTGFQLHGSKNLAHHWKKTLEKAGVQKTRLYNTRHTFIVNMIKDGAVSILEIAQMVGHADTEMIVKNYATFRRGEQLKVSRHLDPFGLQFG